MATVWPDDQSPSNKLLNSCMNQIVPVILCGGSGSRLWPLSRAGFPKQFLCLTGNESLFQQTVARVLSIADAVVEIPSTIVVSNDDHRFLVSEQLREIGMLVHKNILEPEGKNTAPAVTLAALQAVELSDDPILFVTPADQTIVDSQAFVGAARQAIDCASDGSIVILGITPTHAETGYGYILASPDDQGVAKKVVGFFEKPSAAVADQYLQDGNYYWNAGIFVMRASAWLKAIEQFRPDILDAVRQAWTGRSQDSVSDIGFVRPSKMDFSKVPSESVDYAVLERCTESGFPLKMVPLDAGWDDLGAWDAVWKARPKDSEGNAFSGDVISFDSRNNLVHAQDRLVSLVGVENLVVVETSDAILVADRAKAQDVKRIVEKLNQSSRVETALHRKVNRPWGWYDSIDEGGRFKVKRIYVKPGASLSLQMHHHRAEHWVVVSGTAQITNGEKAVVLSENQSTYIPLGEVHRLKNPGCIPLEIIEIQTGGYLGEDDIVRFDDSYGRL